MFFTSVFKSEISYQMTSADDSKDRGADKQPKVVEQVRDYLNKMDVLKAAGLDECILEY